MKRMLVIIASGSALASFILEGIAFPKPGGADPDALAPSPAEAAATIEAPTSSQPRNSVAQASQSADEEDASADHSSTEEKEGPVEAPPEQRVDPFSADVIQPFSNDGSG
jgi:hypothetical protein